MGMYLQVVMTISGFDNYGNIIGIGGGGSTVTGKSVHVDGSVFLVAPTTLFRHRLMA